MSGLEDASEILNRIRDYANNSAFIEYAEATAMKMVTHLFSDAGRTWRQAAKHNSHGRAIYEALLKEMKGPIGTAVQFQVRRNAEIIRSIPTTIANRVNEHVLREVLKGTRADEIAKQIKSYFPEASKAKAGLIARTEVSKTSTALTQSRSEAVGANWYVWRTSEDSRVRESHKIMDGVLIKWNDPPSPERLDGQSRTFGNYNAGEIFNCRCYPEPVIDLSQVRWPAKVYYNGSIQRMTRNQFEKIA
ncbi:phage minor head protein [Brevibacillus sp. HD1.4A]|uniref:phage head morphogenesis protein n=1 Tax=Brevibacillus sp. HD1.4A TaxID=2738978 RepID=UPI00156B917F|nr:phage minor head protein [Brevibacillus sp. HD1.4A]NRQ51976.1 minor capsid protein [Brevibacillus sp. HD1.4A]